MRDMIEKLTGTVTSPIVYGRVGRRISSLRLEVDLDSGGKAVVQHSAGESYAVGVRVAISSGRIVRTGGTVKNIKVYEV